MAGLRLAGGGKRAFKEVLENFVLFEELIKPLLSGGGTLIELCSGGTALLSFMTFIWTRAHVIAVDREKPSKHLRQIIGERFKYVQTDIFSLTPREVFTFKEKPIVVVGVHCCGTLSFRAVEIGVGIDADFIILVPCCVDRGAAEKVTGKRFETYSDWIKAILLKGVPKYRQEVRQLEGMPTNANIVVLFQKARC